MQLHLGQVEEYTRRHNPIWPELQQVLEAHGVRNYAIFLHPETLQLFACAEIESEARWQAIAETAICRKWWSHMRELMVTEPDDRPTRIALQEVFHLSA